MKTKEIFEANYDFAKAKSRMYFQDDRGSVHRKIFHDQESHPVLSRAMILFTMRQEMRKNRISKLYVFEGSRPIEVKELHAGDIGAIGEA